MPKIYSWKVRSIHLVLSSGRKAGGEGKTEEDRKGMRMSEGLCYGEAWLQLNPEIIIFFKINAAMFLTSTVT